VSAKESELPAGLGGQAALVIGIGRAVDEATDVSVSEASGGELATGDGAEQREVGGIVQAQGAETPGVLDDWAGDDVEGFREGCGVLDRGECV
jgi:hypothetical protein